MKKPPFYIKESMGSQYNPRIPNNNNLRANNSNSGVLWGTIIKIWGLQGYNNNNKGDTLTTIREIGRASCRERVSSPV